MKIKDRRTGKLTNVISMPITKQPTTFPLINQQQFVNTGGVAPLVPMAGASSG